MSIVPIGGVWCGAPPRGVLARRGALLSLMVVLALLDGSIAIAVAGAAAGLVAAPGETGRFGRSTARYHCTSARKVQFESVALSLEGHELYAQGSVSATPLIALHR